jgi:hypothetical protein
MPSPGRVSLSNAALLGHRRVAAKRDHVRMQAGTFMRCGPLRPALSSGLGSPSL